MRITGLLFLLIAALYLLLYKGCYDNGYRNATVGLQGFHVVNIAALLFVGVGFLFYKKDIASITGKSPVSPLEKKPENLVPNKLSSAYWIDASQAKASNGDYNGAMEALTKSIELASPESVLSVAYMLRGELKHKMGDKTCCDDWRKSKELGLEEHSMKLIKKYCSDQMNELTNSNYYS